MIRLIFQDRTTVGIIDLGDNGEGSFCSINMISAPEQVLLWQKKINNTYFDSFIKEKYLRA